MALVFHALMFCSIRWSCELYWSCLILPLLWIFIYLFNLCFYLHLNVMHFNFVHINLWASWKLLQQLNTPILYPPVSAHITHLHCNTRGAVHVLAQCVDLAEQCEAITVSQGRFMPPIQNSSPRKYWSVTQENTQL